MAQQDTQDRILDAAVELIARDGYDGVKLAEIARRAETSTALIHYHFATRSRLLTAAIGHSMQREEARARKRTEQLHRESPAERLADLIDFDLPLRPQDVREWLLWSELENRSTRSPELARALADLYAQNQAPIAAAVADGLAQGVFAPCDPDEVAAMAHALLAGLSIRLLARDAGLTVPKARAIAGRQVALAVGYPGDLPFADRDIPERIPDAFGTPTQPRRRARRARNAGSLPPS